MVNIFRIIIIILILHHMAENFNQGDWDQGFQ